VYALRGSSATLLGVAPETVHVVFTRGSGCYGINGADAVAFDAALMSQAVGKPVRVQLSRKDEMAWENYGLAFVMDQQVGLDPQGNIIGFLIGGKSPGQFSVRRTDNFDISDAVLLPSGDLLLLERKFSWLGGIGIRIRRVPLASVAPGAVIDGPSIFEADLGHEIDNMEGIDAHVTERGETVLTMISDDNFSLIQRNLLLQFTLMD
jgi:hypothetical protein